MSEERLTGSCFCGGVRFSIPASCVGVIACHCHDCQKMHGNYNVMLGAPRGDIVFEVDATLTWFDSSEKAKRGFCAKCGSRLFKDNLGSDRLMVSAGAINEPTGKTIIKNLWDASKGDWYALPIISQAPAPQKLNPQT
jgi:hypothetical protein